jgi:hypothetical protein
MRSLILASGLLLTLYLTVQINRSPEDSGVVNPFAPRMGPVPGGRFDIRGRISLSCRPGCGIDLCRPDAVDPGRHRSHRVRRGGDLARVFHGAFLGAGKPGCGSVRLSRRYLPSKRSRARGYWRPRGSPTPQFLVFDCDCARHRRAPKGARRCISSAYDASIASVAP